MADQETIQDLARSARAFISRELEPLEAQVEAEDCVPPEIRDRLGELGYFGLTIPPEYGGSGLDAASCCAVVQEFGRTHSAFFALIDDNIGMGSHIILQQGNEEQRRQYLPDIASGRAISCFALTEPGAGSDAAALQTYARHDGDGYVLNGRKQYISNACRADYFNVIARTQPAHETDGRLTAFLVEKETPGFTVGRRESMMGLRGACQNELVFEDCRIPAANRLGAEGDGLRAALKALILGRLVVAAWSIGAAERALELGVNYARDRMQFGKPIGQFQGIQWLIADSATELFAARAMLSETAAALEAGTARQRDAGMVKLFATEMAGRVADRMLQVHGGAGYSKSLPLERIYRDVRVQRIIEGTSEIQRMIIARSLLREAGMARE